MALPQLKRSRVRPSLLGLTKKHGANHDHNRGRVVCDAGAYLTSVMTIATYNIYIYVYLYTSIYTYRVLNKNRHRLPQSSYSVKPPVPPPDQGWIRTTLGGRRKLLFFSFFCEGCQMQFAVATLKLGVRGFVEHRSTNSWTWLFSVKNPVYMCALWYICHISLIYIHVPGLGCTPPCGRIGARSSGVGLRPRRLGCTAWQPFEAFMSLEKNKVAKKLVEKKHESHLQTVETHEHGVKIH